MNDWTVVYYDDAKFEKWFKSLGVQKFQAIYEEIQLLAIAGNKLTLPHSKALGNGLFELRERKHGIRIYYTFQKGRIIILLHGGDKSTQSNDIKKCFNLLKMID